MVVMACSVDHHTHVHMCHDACGMLIAAVRPHAGPWRGPPPLAAAPPPPPLARPQLPVNAARHGLAVRRQKAEAARLARQVCAAAPLTERMWCLQYDFPGCLSNHTCAGGSAGGIIRSSRPAGIQPMAAGAVPNCQGRGHWHICTNTHQSVLCVTSDAGSRGHSGVDPIIRNGRVSCKLYAACAGLSDANRCPREPVWPVHG